MPPTTRSTTEKQHAKAVEAADDEEERLCQICFVGSVAEKDKKSVRCKTCSKPVCFACVRKMTQHSYCIDPCPGFKYHCGFCRKQNCLSRFTVLALLKDSYVPARELFSCEHELSRWNGYTAARPSSPPAPSDDSDDEEYLTDELSEDEAEDDPQS